MKIEPQDIDLKWEKLEDAIYDGVWQSQTFFDTCFVVQHEYDKHEERDIYNAFFGDPMLDQGLCSSSSFVEVEWKCKEWAANQINKLLK